MVTAMKLGSLFDGSGGFPLAGAIHGISPAWASEIEPYPIRVTKARFPQMKHLGSVLDVNGAEVEPVDIITFGSPCQDLSIAGKQAGLHKGERSNLFFEAIRIIKEMREATNGKYPRIAVWENVPGAYSSNKGEDFRAVLEAFAQINDEAADVPRPASGKWNPAGAIVGNRWSVAWRTFDAQYWGVPQRRKRIYLIADFGSERAGEILFEQESVRRDIAPGGTAREGAADNVEGSAGGSGVCYPIDLIRESRGAFEKYEENADKSGSLKQSDCKGAQVVAFEPGALTRDMGNRCWNNTAPTLRANMGDNQPGVSYPIEGNGSRPSHQGPGYSDSDKSYTLNTIERHGVCYPVENHPNDSRVSIREDGIVPTLSSRMGTGGNNGPMVMEAYTVGNGQTATIDKLIPELSRTLDCMHDQQIVIKPSKPPRKYIIRRLTPLECCRLQGFPDWWEDDVQGSDSARYKMWGNGIALPNAEYVIGCAKKLIGDTQ
ncbi:MAG: DNA cytosine methyltransferase [Christensenellales bacterium]|jgi:DNA (cytosine-5)-methyltransferase 1